MARWKQAQGSDSLPTGLEKMLVDFGKSSVSRSYGIAQDTDKMIQDRKLVAVPKEDWIVVKNTHEAIIDEETFELVQKFISVKKRPNKTGRPNMFVGLVKCPDCGRNMAFSNPNGREPRFRCRTYARNSNLCTTHAISYDALVKIVMDDIQKHMKNMETLGDQFIEEMRVLSESGGGKE